MVVHRCRLLSLLRLVVRLLVLAPQCCGQSPAPAPAPVGSGSGGCAGADLNSDHAVGVQDLLLVLGAFGSSALSAGAQPLDTDVNGDGLVNVADILLVLGAFGTTCPPRVPSPSPPNSAQEIVGCSAMHGDVCGANSCRRFVPFGMYGRSCAEYCCEFGLGCVGAWEEQANNCVAEDTWTCEQTEKRGGGSTDDVICECDVDGSTLTEACPPSPPTRRTCSDLTVEGHERRTSCVYAPDSELGAELPLIVVLHGYTSNHHSLMRGWHMEQLADDRGVIVAAADGTADPSGTTFWAATDACCNFYASSVDDSGFIRALIEAVQDGWPVDPHRIYVTGHSNGGFMSYRMACDHADLIAGIVSLAGAAFDHAATPLPHNAAYSCAPSEPVHVLQIHGTSDGTISYGGGSINGHRYPSALGSVRRFAAFNGCDDTVSPIGNTLSPELSWDLVQPQGDDTANSWHDNCRPGGSAELWIVEGGGHSPQMCADVEIEDNACTPPTADGLARLTARMVDWLLQRRKP